MTFEDVADARERLPEGSEDRPEDVEDALEPREVVGRNREKPLAGDYSRYPEDPQDILSPQYGDVLADVADHPQVETPEDVATELGVSADLVEKAASLHGIPLPHSEGADGGGSDPTLTLPLEGDVPLEYVRDPPHEDARVLHHLAVTCGMGVEEIATYLSRQVEDQDPDPRDITNGLKRANLMEGTPTDGDRRNTAKGERLEVNRPKGDRHGATTVDLSGEHPEDADRIVTHRADE